MNDLEKLHYLYDELCKVAVPGESKSVSIHHASWCEGEIKFTVCLSTPDHESRLCRVYETYDVCLKAIQDYKEQVA